MSQAPPQIRVTIYDPTMQNVLALDASADIGRGILRYTDTPDGCDAASIPLILWYEDVFARGYWTAQNIVEISSGDNTLKTSISATSSGGTAKLYLDTNWGFDPANWSDAQQAFLWDGVHLTMRCPVNSVGSDGGGQYIVIGTPLGGGGIPAYTAGQTTVGRRRYCGRITRRERVNEKTPGCTITCVGIKNDLSGQIGSYSYNQASNVDIGTAMYGVLNLFASSWPWLTISSGNFPTIGQIYTGTYHDTDPLTFLSDALKQIASNDGWHVRVGHDRTPRLVKLYTASSDTYTVNVTVNQTSPTQAFTLKVADEDCSQFYNQIKIIGDVDPTTKQPVSAIVNDTNSQNDVYGDTSSRPYIVSGQPVQVQGLKTDDECAQYGQALLDANSIAKSAQQLVVYTRRNDLANIALPGGMASGDVLPPIANIVATGFTGLTPTPPDVTGLASSITTSVDCSSTDQYQQASFSAMMPSWTVALQEKANAVATALVSNTLTRAGLDQYFVDQSAYPFTSSPTSFVVNVPSFSAVFAPGTLPVQCGGNSFTLSVNSMTWVWLNPNNSWTLKSDSTILSGSIPYAFFQTNGSGVVGDDNLASIGLLNIPMPYMLNGVPISVLIINSSISPFGTVAAYSIQLSINVTITNQPTDGSLSKVICYFRQTGQTTWLQLATTPPRDGNVQSDGNGNILSGSTTSATGIYSFLFPDAAKGISYDFGIAEESGAQAETAVTLIGTYEYGNGQNFIVDSDMDYVAYSSATNPETGTIATAWATNGTDTGFYFQQNRYAQSNQLNILPADAGLNRSITSEPIGVAVNNEYVLSCNINESAVTNFATGPSSTTTVPRFTPSLWTTDYPSSCFGALVSGTNSVTLTGELNLISDLIGLQWSSQDGHTLINGSFGSLTHALLQYETNNDYSGITLAFTYTASTNLAPISSGTNPPAITFLYVGPTTTAAVSIGATTIPLTSTSGITVGESMTFGNLESVTIATVGTSSVTITAGLTYAHPAGDKLQTFAYLLLANVKTGGTDYNATISINFDTSHTGLDSSDPSWALIKSTQIDEMFFSMCPPNYDPTNNAPLSGGTLQATVEFAGITVTSNSGTSPNASLTIGNIPSPPTNPVGIANDYSGIYLFTPQRIVQAYQSLGYTKAIDHYLSPSQYFALHWNATRGQLEVDSTRTVNSAFAAWHTDYFARLTAAGIPFTASLSFEIYTPYVPLNWDQQDVNGNSGQTGYSPSTTLARFANSTVASYLQSVILAVVALVPSGANFTFQMGEWSWWLGTDNGPTGALIGICIYDIDTRNAYHTATGNFAPTGASAVPGGSSSNVFPLYSSLTSVQQTYVTFCAGLLGSFTDTISIAIRSARPATKVSVLWYADAIFDLNSTLNPGNLNGYLQQLNVPVSHWKYGATHAPDTMELESYGWTTPTFDPASLTAIYNFATGSTGSGNLGFPAANITWYSGFATNPDATVSEPSYFTPMQVGAIQALNLGFGLVYIWAYNEVAEMSYMWGSLDIVLTDAAGDTTYVTAAQVPGGNGIVQVLWSCPSGVASVVATLIDNLTNAAQLPSGSASWMQPQFTLGSAYTNYNPGLPPNNTSPPGGGPSVPGAVNLIPDSSFALAPYAPSSGNPQRADSDPMWTVNYFDNISAYFEQGTAPNGTNSIQIVNGAHPYYAQSAPMSVIPGTAYTLSAYIDMRNFSGGPAFAGIYDVTGTTQYLPVSGIVGQNGRYNGTWTCPSGGSVTSITVMLRGNSSARVSSASGQPNLVLAYPQLEVGATASSYTPGGSTTSSGGTRSTSSSLVANGATIDIVPSSALPTNGSGAPTYEQIPQGSWLGYAGGATDAVALYLQRSTTPTVPSWGKLVDNFSAETIGGTKTFSAVPALPSQSQNLFFASPNGSSGVPSFRALSSADISDYAAGVPWTPTIYGETTAGTNTYSTQSGSYTKIGNAVLFSCTIVMTAKDGTMAGNIHIGGLPFPSNSSGSNFTFPIFISNASLDSGYYTCWAYNVPGQSNFYLFEMPSTGGSSILQPSNINSNSQFYVTGLYFK